MQGATLAYFYIQTGKQTSMAEQFLTVEQAADRLQVHPTTIRRHLQSGTLRGVKRGSLWRVPESALMEPSKPTVSPLVRAVQLIKARDAREGEVTVRQDGSAASDLRAVREARTP